MGRPVLWIERLVDRVVGQWPRGVFVDEPERAPELTSEAATIFRAVAVVAAVSVALQSVTHLVNLLVFDLSIERLDADKDLSMWSWTGSSSELMAALGAALLLLFAHVRRRVLAFITGAVLFLSLDDTVGIHERLSQSIQRIGDVDVAGRVLWPILYAPLMGVTFVLLWRVSGAFVRRCQLAVRVGLVVLGLAVVLEAVVAPVIRELGYARPHLAYELEVVVEEGFELGGWLLVAAALLASGVDLLVRRARLAARVGTAADTATRAGRRAGGRGAP